ncbi:MAG: flagellar basal body rod protein FlgB [Gammaproteobacteria bacterium]|nr:flagellar basal body rod protein FlgB [Gammaproteobacteria bacterium]
MTFSLDAYLGLHAEALELRARRMEVLAGNLANADTPHYKARDIDFREVLRETNNEALKMQTSHQAHSASANETQLAPLKYRIPLQPALDGNTVDTNLEKAAFAENSVQYQASLQFVNGRIRSMMLALTGDS